MKSRKPRCKALLLALCAAAPAALVPVAPAMGQDRPLAERPLPVIRVAGEGSVSVAPDIAVVVLGVTREADTAREAATANTAAMTEVIEAVKQAGVEARDIQTSGFRIEPRYIYPQPDKNGVQKPPSISGYVVSNQITVRVRDIGKVGEILDRAVTLGVNSEGNIAFTNDDPSAAIASARTAAVKDAAARAITLADAAGVRVGGIVEIAETSGMPRPMPMARGKLAMAAEAAVPVEAGENEYTVRVEVTFEIAQ